MGDSLASLTVKELKQLENRLERGITRIRSKKVTHLDTNSNLAEHLILWLEWNGKKWYPALIKWYMKIELIYDTAFTW